MPPPLTRQEVRDVDRRAIEEFGMSGLQLMENAARGAAELLLKQNPSGLVLIVAGKGNNAGDGFVMARHLELSGHKVKVLLLVEINDLKGDALFNFRVIEKSHIPIVYYQDQTYSQNLSNELDEAVWIVDAMMGTGMTGRIREPFRTVITLINQSHKNIFSVDLPSGLNCDTGQTDGFCVRADITATFVALKTGFDHPVARGFLGKVHVIDIGVPLALLRAYE